MWDNSPLGTIEHKDWMQCGTIPRWLQWNTQGGCDVTSCDKVRL